MHRPAVLVAFVLAAVLPVVAFAAPVTTPLPVPGAFERVAVGGDLEVSVREGSPASVQVVAEPGLAERVKAEVEGGVLRLSRRTSWFESSGPVRIEVVLPTLRGLSVAGSGSVLAESGPTPRDLSFSVAGSGDLAWSGTASTVSASVAGSGDARLAGVADRLKVSVAGSGDVDASALAARDASVAVAGSGDVAIRLAGGTLDARVAGSGDVTWSGEGKLGAVSTAGSGRVKPRA